MQGTVSCHPVKFQNLSNTAVHGRQLDDMPGVSPSLAEELNDVPF
jgi:hypothetical protein